MNPMSTAPRDGTQILVKVGTNEFFNYHLLKWILRGHEERWEDEGYNLFAEHTLNGWWPLPPDEPLWLPIESAPKQDGKKVLIANILQNGVIEWVSDGEWNEEKNRWMVFSDLLPAYCTPNIWMPMPKHPKEGV